MRILVGTVGQSILASDDGGDSWQRLGPRNGFQSDGIVRTLINDPNDPAVLYAGTDQGILRSDDAGRCWQRLGGVLADKTVWRIALHPTDPKVLFAGTGTPSLPGLYRSQDAGASWQQLPVEIAPDCPNVGVPRVTDIAIDPAEPRNIWVSIEVDGARFSSDGGDTWTRIDARDWNPDGHAAVVAAGPPKTVFLTMSNEIHITEDDGVSWRKLGVKNVFPWTHVRDLVFDSQNPHEAWAAIGDFTPGTKGALMHTTDLCKSWQQVDMPVPPNSAMWVVRMQPDNPDLMFAASRYGYLYRSDDHGRSWSKLTREFSEISSVVWVPEA